MGPFLQMDLDGYRGSFAKLWGYTNSVRLAAEHMDERGTIVLVSGTPARRAKSGQVSLASVGGAVEAFLPRRGPRTGPRRINVVSPGIIDTPMFGDDLDRRQQLLAGAGQQASNSASGHGRGSGGSHHVFDQKRLCDRHDRRCGWGLVTELRSTSPAGVGGGGPV